jgi:hypothetical protein
MALVGQPKCTLQKTLKMRLLTLSSYSSKYFRLTRQHCPLPSSWANEKSINVSSQTRFIL